MNIENNIEITPGDNGKFHGDLQIGEYRSILTESTPELLKFRMKIQLIDRVWFMIKDIEAGN